METVITSFVLLNPPSLLEGILLLLLLLIVLYGSSRSTKNLVSRKKRTLIISLHFLSFLLIIFILFNPAFRVEHYKEEKKDLSIFVDNSWSMNLPGNKDGNIRDQIVKEYINNNDTFFSQIEKNFQVSYFLFNDKLQSTTKDSILSSKAVNSKTDIGKVLGELNERDDSDVAIIISDGAQNTEPSESIEEMLDEINTKIYTVNPVNEDIGYDAWIDDISSSEVAFLRYPFSIDVVIKSNISETFAIPVSLYEEDKLIAIKEVSMKPDSKASTVTFEINPLSLGRKIYTVAIPVISNEYIIENNQKSFFTDVIINKIRVLHVAGSPSWDVRFLRKALKRNPNIDLVSFFILRDPSDLVFASERELSLIPFPVNDIFSKELDTFDVVIFQDFHFQPYGIFGFHLNNLKDYVSRDGGAFLMIGGSNSFNSGNYGSTSISDILPVELDYSPKTLAETISAQKFHTELTGSGKNHAITRIIPNRDENERHWNTLPELESLNIVNGLSQSAIPLLSTADGQPILAVDNINTGKVAAFMSDSSWKWNFALGSEGNVSPHYEKFWNRLFLWFVNDPELQDIKINTDKPIYGPGETAKIEISTLSEDYSDSRIKAVITSPSGEETEIELDEAEFESLSGEFEVKEDGIYRLSVIPDSSSGQYAELNKVETVFVVEAPQSEVRGPTTNKNLLKSIAEVTGGKYITTEHRLEELNIDASRKKSITGYKTVKLWDNPLTFVVLIGLLSSEWILRRRWGLR